MRRFEDQGKHLTALFILLIPVIWFARLPGTLDEEWLGVSTQAWYWLAIAIPVIHQFGTMLLWRLELHGQRLTRALGDKVFNVFLLFFFPGLIGRPISVIALALSDQGSLGIAAWILNGIVLIMVPILVYLFYSILRYFGVKRAAGADHFFEEYQTKTLVVDGIYRYIPNAMYVVGFFIVWIPALILASRAALVVAAFQHALIWGHYFFTEVPDMAIIYEDIEGDRTGFRKKSRG
jgi:hypothetical protein